MATTANTDAVTETNGRPPKELAHGCHPQCIVCSPHNGSGLNLHCECQPDGSVVGRFTCDPAYQGYPDRLHGGVVAMLLDGAMTQCLFARNIRAVTGKLEIRFSEPVRVDAEAVVRASVERASPPGYKMRSELVQNDRVCARAEALFYETDDDTG